MDRRPSAAGGFYPGSKTALLTDLQELFAEAGARQTEQIRAIVVPHAGYVFSGKVAATAYAQIPQDTHFDNVFILASSHYVLDNHISTFLSGNYSTPLGEVLVNTDLTEQLAAQADYIHYSHEADAPEHSIEVQLPFIQYWLAPSCKIVPLIICTRDEVAIAYFAALLAPYFNERNLFVISSDFSHYPSYDDAKRVDKETADAILKNSPQALLNVRKKHKATPTVGLQTDLCGWTSVLTLLHITQNKDYRYAVVDYANSGDSMYGELDRVVGYTAITVSENADAPKELLSKSEKETLLKIARESIAEELGKSVVIAPELTEVLRKPFGAFVTLTVDGKLHGCIGQMMASDELHKQVKDMAHSAAFSDPRFPPMTAEEFKRMEIEISVLTPLQEIDSIDEIELGRHGILIESTGRSGTFLPQVATETNWTKEEFLGHCARDKAGIGWDGWKHAKIYTYEAYVFKE